MPEQPDRPGVWRTYVTPSGREFVLAWSTPEEWAAAWAARLDRLGVSLEYAEEVCREIRAAVPKS
jgi:hypothetical protein